MNRRERHKRKKRKNIIIVLCAMFILFVTTSWIIVEIQAKNQQAVTKSKPVQKSAALKPTKPFKPKPVKEKPTETTVNNQEIDNYLQQIGFSGSVLIVRDGKTIVQKGYLDANRETKQPNTPDTLYYIGSSQKAIIATAILQLEEQGKISTDDPISKYLPNFPNGNQIYIKNFLNHTSGIVGHQEKIGTITPEKLIEDIEKQGIESNTGAWNYSDSNYAVLAYLVEILSGKSLKSYLKEKIFEPSGMKNTGFNQKDVKKGENDSTGYYINKDGSYRKPELVDLSQMYGSGDICMTAQDLYLFDKALMDKKLISETSLKKMFTSGSTSGYGMGFYVDPGSYNSHGVLSGWNVSNSMSHTGRTYVILFSNIQNNIASFGKVNNHIYNLLNK
ncbi:beta-lactamase family protein [Listeria sp. FSL L7-1517]|uniref:serine hydrolase domain-containing protein n=1 Tax=Listeria immobilis TaxID=2713502 RepID=UPI00164EA772|nr:serine hydrolase domain-containing protein [Listeria immobilis]MBC6296242.1 beta-lactamase family protein [Listeria immobilis]